MDKTTLQLFVMAGLAFVVGMFCLAAHRLFARRRRLEAFQGDPLLKAHDIMSSFVRPKPPASAAPSGWRDLRWGASSTELGERTEHESWSGGLVRSYGRAYEDLTFDGLKLLAVYYNYYDDKLYSIRIIYDVTTRNQITKYLFDKYDKPSLDSDGHISCHWIWPEHRIVFKTTGIVLSYSPLANLAKEAAKNVP
ncbi:MAG: hypothetical protein LBU12_06390 [Deltaproteobacteria bacterium]|jgi:hypothetical protein|nr:hypothetical protein [Deltaproteobacteria bacterium]